MRASLSRRQFLTISAGSGLAGLVEARASVLAQGLTPLNVGMSFTNLDAASAWVAKDKGLFERYGLTVTIINIQGGAKFGMGTGRQGPIRMRRILEFCELRFEPQCLEFHKNQRSVRTASSEQVRRPIYKEGRDQWRHFEPWLAPLREALGDLANG